MLALHLTQQPLGLEGDLLLALRPLFEHAVDLDADRRQHREQDQDEEACQKGHGVDEAPTAKPTGWRTRRATVPLAYRYRTYG